MHEKPKLQQTDPLKFTTPLQTTNFALGVAWP